MNEHLLDPASVWLIVQQGHLPRLSGSEYGLCCLLARYILTNAVVLTQVTRILPQCGL